MNVGISLSRLYAMPTFWKMHETCQLQTVVADQLAEFECPKTKRGLEILLDVEVFSVDSSAQREQSSTADEASINHFKKKKKPLLGVRLKSKEISGKIITISLAFFLSKNGRRK